MEGLSNRSAAEELAKQFYAARNSVLRAETSVKEVEASVERAALCTDQITKCAHIANESLRLLWSQCWTRAADLTNTEIQLSTEFVVDGEVQRLTHDRESIRKLCQLKARMYVSNAMCELNTADEYFRAACGAEAGKTSNRDPREVEWWRCAAALQTAAFEKCMSCIDDIVDVGHGEEQCLKLLCKSVEESRRGADAYATAADYMRRANQLRTTLSHLKYAASVAELFTLLAEVLVHKAEKGEAVSNSRAQMFCLKLIDVKSGVKKNVPAEVISLLERSCMCIRQWINALAADSKSAMSWRTTLSVCFQAYQTSKTGWNEQASMSVLMATVFAKQAETQLHDYDYYVYLCAAAAMDKAREACASSGCKDVKVADHLAVSAARVCMLSKLEIPVPEELVRFAQEVTVDGRVEPILRDCVEAHRLKAECLSECLQMGVDGAKHKLLSQAHSELNALIADCESQLQYTIHPRAEGKRISDQHIIHILKTSALRRVSAKCCMAAARSGSRVWDAAVQMCGDTKGTIHEREATQAIERYTSAAEATLNDDTELSELYTSAAHAARQLWEKLRTARKDERIFYAYKLMAADHLILELLARRKGRVVLAEVHAQIAKLSDQVCSLSHRLNDRAKRQSVIVSIDKLHDRVTNLCYLESQRAAQAVVEVLDAAPQMPTNSTRGTKKTPELSATAVSAHPPRTSSSLRASVATRKRRSTARSTLAAIVANATSAASHEV